MVSIEMDESALVRKSLGRRACPECRRGFNVAHIDEPGLFMPAVLPTDPACIEAKCVDRFAKRAVRLPPLKCL